MDSSVLRYKEAVTLFGPGSHQYMASTKTSFSNLFITGDWLQQGPGSHGARGLSQEKSYVSRLIAANASTRSLGIDFCANIIGVEERKVERTNSQEHICDGQGPPLKFQGAALLPPVA